EAEGAPVVRTRHPYPLGALADRSTGHRDAGGLRALTGLAALEELPTPGRAALNSSQRDGPGRCGRHRPGRHQGHLPKGIGEDVEYLEHLLEASRRLFITPLQPMRGAI